MACFCGCPLSSFSFEEGSRLRRVEKAVFAKNRAWSKKFFCWAQIDRGTTIYLPTSIQEISLLPGITEIIVDKGVHISTLIVNAFFPCVDFTQPFGKFSAPARQFQPFFRKISEFNLLMKINGVSVVDYFQNQRDNPITIILESGGGARLRGWDLESILRKCVQPPTSPCMVF
jgi:hypothetical protein